MVRLKTKKSTFFSTGCQTLAMDWKALATLASIENPLKKPCENMVHSQNWRIWQNMGLTQCWLVLQF
jgi:hypothetical protein